MSGDRAAGAMTVVTRLRPLIACAPLATIVAPIKPPIRAWLELDGIVKYQVIRFHRIAPIRAARTRTRPALPARTCGLTIPLAIVAATLIEMNAPAKLRIAESATATLGLRAPLAIEVAIALAVSWNPLVKSNASAATTTRMRTSMTIFRRHAGRPDPASHHAN